MRLTFNTPDKKIAAGDVGPTRRDDMQSMAVSLVAFSVFFKAELAINHNDSRGDGNDYPTAP